MLKQKLILYFVCDNPMAFVHSSPNRHGLPLQKISIQHVFDICEKIKKEEKTYYKHYKVIRRYCLCEIGRLNAMLYSPVKRKFIQ